MSDDFLSHEQACRELQLSEEELNELVAKGELRAFHDEGQVRFKAEDLTAIKKSRETEPTIILSDTQAESIGGSGSEQPIDLDSLSADETVLNIEGLLEDETEGTTPIPGIGVLEDEEIQVGSVGEDTVLDTQGLDLEGDFELSEDDTLPTEEADTLMATGGVRSVRMIKKESHTAITVMLSVTLLLLLAPLAILLNLMSGAEGTYPSWISDGFFSVLNPVVDLILKPF